MNVVKTYTLLLQYISVMSSCSTDESYLDKATDNNFELK
jgi:hypothetical protein